jgi:small conductance mechanosensitive channel
VLEDILDVVGEWAPRVIGAVIVLVIARFLIRAASKGLRSAMDKRDVEASAAKFLGSILTAVLWTAVLIAVLGIFGVPTNSFIAVLGALGLAIGLALQDSIANLASGILILVAKPFVAGEFVEIAGLQGSVHAVEIIATTLLTPDNKQVIIPNGQVTSEPITNYSREDKRRVDLVFGIGYDDDLKAAKQILVDLAAEDERVLDEPEPQFPVLNLGESSVDIGARVWVRTDDYWPLYFDWTEHVKLAYDAAGISIPYPQRDIHVIESGAAAPSAKPTFRASSHGDGSGGDVADMGDEG